MSPFVALCVRRSIWPNKSILMPDPILCYEACQIFFFVIDGIKNILLACITV